jgi:hypothetical protein
MNALEILGLACVDRVFREQLFKNVEAVIVLNRTDLTWAEEEGLRRITRSRFTKRKAKALSMAGEQSAATGAVEGEEASTLKDDLEKVGDTIDMMCPTVPCAWPDSFTQNARDK